MDNTIFPFIVSYIGELPNGDTFVSQFHVSEQSSDYFNPIENGGVRLEFAE